MRGEDLYVYLTCTAHGTPVWRATTERDPNHAGLPDRHLHIPPPGRRLGPYRVGPDGYGYGSVEEAVSNDPSEVIDLADSTTWFPCPRWINHYLADVVCEACTAEGE